MLYLKNTLGGWSRTLTDSALSTFQGPHRWWKLAFYVVLFVLPGGSVGVAVLAWVEHRKSRTAAAAKGDGAGAATALVPCQGRGNAACRGSVRKTTR